MEKKLKEPSKFNPNDHMQNIKGKDYLPVAARLVWFREDHPTWGIETSIQHYPDKSYAIGEAKILDDSGKLIAMAHKMENVAGFGDYLEKAETGAVGRALAYVGYGTQFAPELEEGEVRIVDAPTNAPAKPVEAPKPKLDTISGRYIATPEGAIRSARYFAVMAELGVGGEKAKEYVKNKLKLESYTDITKVQLEPFIKSAESKLRETEAYPLDDIKEFS